MYCWSLLVDDVAVVEKGVEGLDPWHSDAVFLRELDGRPKVGFDFHRPLSREILIHDAIGLCRL